MGNLSSAEAWKNVAAQQAAADAQTKQLALIEQKIASAQKPLLRRIAELEARVAKWEGGTAD